MLSTDIEYTGRCASKDVRGKQVVKRDEKNWSVGSRSKEGEACEGANIKFAGTPGIRQRLLYSIIALRDYTH